MLMYEEQQAMKLLRFIMALDEIVPWYTGYTVEGFTMKRQDGGHFLIFRSCRPNGERVVCFYGGHKQWDCWYSFAYDLCHHSVKWSQDKYAK